MRDAGDLDEALGLHEVGLDAVARGLGAGKILGVHRVEGGVVGKVFQEDMVEGHVGQRGAGGFERDLDGVENGAGLRGGVAGVEDCATLA